MQQHTAQPADRCVEGWSTDDQAWTGVRLRDLARLAGAANPASVLVQSLQQRRRLQPAVLSAGQIMDPDSLLALRVNGADLSARPRLPGPGDRARQSRRAQHQVGRQHDLRELTCAGSRAGTAPIPCTCSPCSAASPSPGYAAAQLLPSRPLGVAVWFVGAVIGHDLLLMPLYSLADRSVMAAFRHRAAEAARGAVDQLPAGARRRCPACCCSIWFPLILRLPTRYHASTTLSLEPVPVALARRDRRAVPAVRRRVRAAAPRRASRRRAKGTLTARKRNHQKE